MITSQRTSHTFDEILCMFSALSYASLPNNQRHPICAQACVVALYEVQASAAIDLPGPTAHPVSGQQPPAAPVPMVSLHECQSLRSVRLLCSRRGLIKAFQCCRRRKQGLRRDSRSWV